MPGRKELRLVELAIANLHKITPEYFELLWCGWVPPEQLERTARESNPASLVLETGPRPARCP